MHCEGCDQPLLNLGVSLLAITQVDRVDVSWTQSERRVSCSDRNQVPSKLVGQFVSVAHEDAKLEALELLKDVEN